MRYRLRLGVFSFVLLVILAGVGKKYFFDNRQNSFAVQEKQERQDKQEPQKTEQINTGSLNDEPEIKKEPTKKEPIQSLGTGTYEHEDRTSLVDNANDQDSLLKKYLFAQYLYTTKKESKALPVAISLAIQLGKYDEANEFIQDLPDAIDLQDIVSFDVLMKLLFNTTDLSFGRLKQIKTVIENAFTAKKIDLATYNWYFFLMTVIKGDLDNAHYYLDGLINTQGETKRDQLSLLQKATEAYGATPQYHLRAVRAMYLYRQGRRGPALHIGQEIRQQDPNYLLAEQLIAYSSIALQDWKQAIYALQHLQKIDASYSDMYQFFQGIAHYFLGEYNESILLLKQVPGKSAYENDINRYLLLNYVAIGERNQVTDLIKKILEQKQLSRIDFATLFDLLLFFKTTDNAGLSSEDQEMVETLLSRCQKELKEDLHVCLYGKGGLLYRLGEEKKAYMILHRIVERYPKKWIYELLIGYSEKEGLQDTDKRTEKLFLLESEPNTDYVPEV